MLSSVYTFRITCALAIPAAVALALSSTTQPALAGWSKSDALPVALQQAASDQLNGIIYVAGGIDSNFNAVSTLYGFNPETNASTQLANMPGAKYGQAIADVNGQLYLAEGNNGSQNTADLWIYDPPTNTWTTGPSLSQSCGGGVAANMSGQLYVYCVYGGGTINLFESYNPTSGNWTNLVGPAYVHGGGTGAAINGKFYLASGGGGNNQGNDQLEVYDPIANVWSTLASLPTNTGTAYAYNGAINGELWVIGGYNGAFVNTVEIYDPYKNSWQTGTSLRETSGYGTAATAYGFMYVMGGVVDNDSTPTANTYRLSVKPAIP